MEEVSSGRADDGELAPCSGVKSRAEIVDHAIIEAEVKLTRGDLGGQDRLEAGDRVVEQAVARIDLPGEPVDNPWGGGLLVIGGLFESRQGVGYSAFALEDARQVYPAVGPPQFGHFEEDLLGLFQLSLLSPLARTFQEEPDAVIVIALPGRLDWRRGIRDGGATVGPAGKPGRAP